MSDQWTVEQQRALNEALVLYPATMDRRERWKYDFFHALMMQTDCSEGSGEDNARMHCSS